MEAGAPCNDNNFCTTNDSCQPYLDNYDEPFLNSNGNPVASCQGEFVGDGLSCDDYEDECTVNDTYVTLLRNLYVFAMFYLLGSQSDVQ